MLTAIGYTVEVPTVWAAPPENTPMISLGDAVPAAVTTVFAVFALVFPGCRLSLGRNSGTLDQTECRTGFHQQIRHVHQRLTIGAFDVRRNRWGKLEDPGDPVRRGRRAQIALGFIVRHDSAKDVFPVCDFARLGAVADPGG